MKPQEVCCKPKQCHFKLLAVAKRRHHSGNSALCAVCSCSCNVATATAGNTKLTIKAESKPNKANNVSHNDRFPRGFHRFPRKWTLHGHCMDIAGYQISGTGPWQRRRIRAGCSNRHEDHTDRHVESLASDEPQKDSKRNSTVVEDLSTDNQETFPSESDHLYPLVPCDFHLQRCGYVPCLAVGHPRLQFCVSSTKQHMAWQAN